MMAAEDKGGKMAVNGQVFFLVHEQAKSIVAIQALQTRMAVLESLQERLMRAIDDVHLHIAASKEIKHVTAKKPPTHPTSEKIPSTGDKKLRFVQGTESTKQELSKSDSLNKDSGISESSLVATNDGTNLPESEDELLQLLELIDQKSLMLLKQVEGTSMLEQMDSSSSTMDGQSSVLLDTLLFEKVNTQRQLSEVKAERDDLRHRLAKLELATEAVTKQKMKVQQELDATLIENQTLQERIQRNGDSGRKAESLGYLADIERANIKKKYLQNSEKSKSKVSLILKEGNVLELQKQLLAYVMENDVLRAKLQQDEPSRMATWLRIESQLRKKLKESSEDNQRLRELLITRDLEIASLKDRIRAMEEDTEADDDSCVKNFGMGSTEDWREPGIQNMYNKRSNLANGGSPFSALGYGDFSKTQSLPAMLMQDAKLQESMQANFNHVYDTGSFTDVPLNSSYHSEEKSHSKDLVDLSSPVEPNFSSTSTLVQSNYVYQPTLSAPNLCSQQRDVLQQNWAFASTKMSNNNDDAVVGAKLVNGHLCWKGSNRPSVTPRHQSLSEEISSICTEFDPLSDDTPSCENFVDSLNLSIPLKPTQVAISQLSSIGDSLHSNSLDLGCASSPVLFQDSCKVHNARSVDGIRELLLDNGYCKRPVSSQYGHSSVAPSFGKTGRRMPVNIMNYMHDSSDYSLL